MGEGGGPARQLELGGGNASRHTVRATSQPGSPTDKSCSGRAFKQDRLPHEVGLPPACLARRRPVQFVITSCTPPAASSATAAATSPQ